MSEAKHTKGPWQAVQHYSDSVSVVDAGGFRHIDAEHIAILLGYSEKLGIDHWADSPEASREVSPEEQAANARLIAASPAMLEALETIYANATDLAEEASESEASRRMWRICAGEARAAINKATGAA